MSPGYEADAFLQSLQGVFLDVDFAVLVAFWIVMESDPFGFDPELVDFAFVAAPTYLYEFARLGFKFEGFNDRFFGADDNFIVAVEAF